MLPNYWSSYSTTKHDQWVLISGKGSAGCKGKGAVIVIFLLILFYSKKKKTDKRGTIDSPLYCDLIAIPPWRHHSATYSWWDSYSYIPTFSLSNNFSLYIKMKIEKNLRHKTPFTHQCSDYTFHMCLTLSRSIAIINITKNH
jgi:hypothetical protein